MHLLTGYLDKREEISIIDTLVNVLYSNFINESFFYIPQLCTMITYKPYYEPLENYILDRCVDRMKFSLKVHWLISSYVENADKIISKKYDKLLQRIEMTLVNGRRATISNYKMYSYLKIKTEEQVYQHALDKEFRLNYFDKVMRFYHDLKSLCEKLKDIPKENKLNPSQTRNEVMRNHLKYFNKNIRAMDKSIEVSKIKTITDGFYKGFILPFDDAVSTGDEYNTLIVNFLPQYSFCFSTKARVPIKITVETIRVLECCEWEDLIFGEELAKEDKIITEDIKQEETKSNENDMGFQVIEYASIEDFFDKLSRKKSEKIEEDCSPITNRPTRLKSESKFKSDLILNKIVNQTEENFLYDPLNTINPFGPRWSDLANQIKEKSAFRNFETYSIKSFIAKANDDLRQEVMMMQLIKRFDDIFRNAEIPLKLRPYEILITSPSSGLIEFIPNTISIDGLKKNLPDKWDLNIFFRNFFSLNFEEAQKNFAESLAAYSLISYICQIRDRHNGNILLDMNGNLIHIDFGFILGISPGNLGFESAPFKLTLVHIKLINRNMFKF